MNVLLNLSLFLFLFLIFYVYAGYPLLMGIYGIVRPRPVKREESIEPSVSLIIPAFNEESGIENTLENKLALDYPPHKMEIIVVSDGSEDRTDDIVKAYEG